MSDGFQERYERMLASIDALEAHVMFPGPATEVALSETQAALRVDLESVAERLGQRTNRS